MTKGFAPLRFVSRPLNGVVLFGEEICLILFTHLVHIPKGKSCQIMAAICSLFELFNTPLLPLKVRQFSHFKYALCRSVSLSVFTLNG